MDYTADTRSKMASDGRAMKNGSFPIANKKDLANAVTSYGRANDKMKPMVKHHIKKRAAALGATSLLPDNWQH